MFRMRFARLFGKSQSCRHGQVTAARTGPPPRLEVLRLEDRTVPSILGTADSFAVLAGQAVTNTGPSVIVGDLGLSPGTSVTGFPPGSVVPPYTIHAADAVALQAQNDLVTAYNTVAGEARSATLTGQDLGGLTLTPGVYFFSAAAQLTGTVTLDAQGDPNARFDFQIGSTLTTATNSLVSLINSADGCNVYWQVGSSATLGTTTVFEGSILALTSITLNTGATILDGRALARNGSVTLDTNNITADACASISGMKFNDHNGNGVQDVGDAGVQGLTVFLDTNNNGILDASERSTITNAAGNYSFDNLAPGTYLVREVQQPGLRQTTPNPAPITVSSGQNVTGVNFGDSVSSPGGSGNNSLIPTFPLTSPPPTEFFLNSKSQLLGSSVMPDAHGLLLAQASFVSGLYQNILGRTPDAAGLTGWVQMLQDGVTRADVADSFWQSVEHRVLEVNQFYGEFLHRLAGTSESSYWANVLRSGASELDVMSRILSSPEYTASHVSDSAFVNGLYGDVLSRGAEPTVQAAWLQVLASGTSRAAVARMFLASDEASRRVVDDAYVHLLGRPADPAGEQFWIAVMKNGKASFETLVIALLSSDEYLAYVKAV